MKANAPTHIIERRNTSPEIPRVHSNLNTLNISELIDQSKPTNVSFSNLTIQMNETETSEKVNQFTKDLFDLEDKYNFVVANGENLQKRKEVMDAIHQFHLSASSLLNCNGEKLNLAPSFSHRPGSAGLNISDIAPILYDEKMKQSDSHKKIIDFICHSWLLDLNKKIPTSKNCHPDKSTNAAHLLKWVDQQELSAYVEENLTLFKKALLNLCQLLEIARESINFNGQIPCLDLKKDLAVLQILKEFETNENAARHFYEINECLDKSFGDDEGKVPISPNVIILTCVMRKF